MEPVLSITNDTGRTIPPERLALVRSVFGSATTETELATRLDALQIRGEWSGPNDTVWIGYDYFAQGWIEVTRASA